MAARLNAQEKQFIRNWYLADESRSLMDAAKLMGVSRSTMQRALAGVLRPQGGRTEVRTDLLKELRDRGLTYAEIGDRVGLSLQAVHYRLSKED
jgi:hypothetical protein